MNLKILCIISLALLTLSHILLSLGFDFLQNQRPVDYTHWIMLIGACLSLSFSFVFPKSIINIIATVITILGVIAHIGMCTIDFMLWSYGDDYDGRNALIGQIMNTSSISIPFLTVGPAMLFAGLTTQVWYFIKSHTLAAILALVGSSLIGLGQMVLHNRMAVVGGFVIFSIGMLLLVFRKERN